VEVLAGVAEVHDLGGLGELRGGNAPDPACVIRRGLLPVPGPERAGPGAQFLFFDRPADPVFEGDTIYSASEVLSVRARRPVVKGTKSVRSCPLHPRTTHG
jgi:hypothetical protein